MAPSSDRIEDAASSARHTRPSPHAPHNGAALDLTPLRKKLERHRAFTQTLEALQDYAQNGLKAVSAELEAEGQKQPRNEGRVRDLRERLDHLHKEKAAFVVRLGSNRRDIMAAERELRLAGQGCGLSTSGLEASFKQNPGVDMVAGQDRSRPSDPVPHRHSHSSPSRSLLQRDLLGRAAVQLRIPEAPNLDFLEGFFSSPRCSPVPFAPPPPTATVGPPPAAPSSKHVA